MQLILDHAWVNDLPLSLYHELFYSSTLIPRLDRSETKLTSPSEASVPWDPLGIPCISMLHKSFWVSRSRHEVVLPSKLCKTAMWSCGSANTQWCSGAAPGFACAFFGRVKRKWTTEPRPDNAYFFHSPPPCTCVYFRCDSQIWTPEVARATRSCWRAVPKPRVLKPWWLQILLGILRDEGRRQEGIS